MTNQEIAALISKGQTEIEATTIKYGDWKQRVDSGFYDSRHVDPMTGTAWGRGLAYLDQAAAALTAPAPAPAPTPVPPPPPPPSGATFTQGYSTAEMQALLQGGSLVRVAADRLVALSATLVQFQVRPGDQYLAWSGERSQIQRTDIQGGEGEPWRWQFSVTLEPSFVFSPGFYNVVWEHHHQGSTGSPPFTLQLKAGRWVMRVTTDTVPGNNWTEYDVSAAVPGQTSHVVVDCLLSSDPAKAKSAVTIDGHTATAPNHRNLYAGSKVYPMWGLYRAPSPLVQGLSFGPVSRF